MTAARVGGSSIGERSWSIAWSPARHCTAIAPWPGAGSIRSTGSHSATSCSSPRRTIPGPGQEHRVVLAVPDLADTRVDVAADRAGLELRMEEMKLRDAAEAARPDHRSGSEVGEGCAPLTDYAVTGISTLAESADRDVD